MLLQLVNQDLGYGGGPVLRDISISIHAGDRIALVGESGAGKSTLLTAIQARLLGQAAKIDTRVSQKLQQENSFALFAS